MRRYHSPVGTGGGTTTSVKDFVYSRAVEYDADTVMREADQGYWVRHTDAMGHIRVAEAMTLEAQEVSRKQQSLIQELERERDAHEVDRCALLNVYEAWVRTYKKLGQSAVSPMGETEALIDKLIGTRDAKTEGPLQTRTSQLINELYHDRARLERVVADAVSVMETVESALDVLYGEDDQAEIMGHVKQFVDTHKGTE